MTEEETTEGLEVASKAEEGMTAMREEATIGQREEASIGATKGEAMTEAVGMVAMRADLTGHLGQKVLEHMEGIDLLLLSRHYLSAY